MRIESSCLPESTSVFGAAGSTARPAPIGGLDAALKNVLDRVLSAVGLVLLSPLLTLIGVMVARDSHGPVLYRRRVLGQGGRPFDAFKFRTMVADADAALAADPDLRSAFEEGFKLRDDPRVTRVGKLLRRTSLDELPQLINVLRGEMSLVGPRMIAPEEAVRYGQWRFDLLSVKPGITGPWQVRGRSDLPYEERVRLSLDYIRNYSIWLDLGLLLRTIPVVLKTRGAY
jgi:lipopolysaccharide/colanic/teichoic acid biosynthesis glycosyltransferase